MGYNTTTGLFDQYTAIGWSGVLTNATQTIPRSALPAGTVLQVLTSIRQGEQSTTSTSFTNTALSVSITPTSSTSKIFLLYTGSAGNDTTSESFLTFAKNGTNLLGAGGAMRIWLPGSSNYHFGGYSMSYIDSPATTSATTYTVQFRTLSGVVYISGANATDTFSVWEIAA
jgi:hypothetical protein